MRTTRAIDDWGHDMVVPAIGIVIGDDHRRALPERRFFESVDRVHQKCLLIERIRVHGMPVLIRRGLQETHGRQIAGIISLRRAMKIDSVVALQQE